jgi:hemin uptake protein HemP
VTDRPRLPSSGAQGSAAGQPAPAQPQTSRRVPSAELFDGAAELQIDHNGTLYRLRQTSLGKLILTK